MKRISSLSFLAALAALSSPASAQFVDYRFYEAATSAASLRDVTYDGTTFWAVGDGSTLYRSGVLDTNVPGQPQLKLDRLTINGAANEFTTVLSLGSSHLAIGAGTGESTNNTSVGALYRLSRELAANSINATTIPEPTSFKLGKVTDLVVSGPNLVRLGNRFAVGRYPVTTLTGGSPAAPSPTSGVSPFFEDYQQAVLIGSRLFLAGQYRGEPLERGLLSVSRDNGAENAPASEVVLFQSAETARVRVLATDGTALYLAGDGNFVGVLPNASTVTTLPAATSSQWAKTNEASAINAIVSHGSRLFVAGQDGIHQRSAGVGFLGSREKASNLTSPVQALAVATAGDLEDLVVGVSNNKLIVGGPIPAVPVLSGFREHFIDSDGANVVQVDNLVAATTTSQRSIAYDIYKVQGGVAGASPIATVGPLKSAPSTGVDLAGLSQYDYGTNVFRFVARDVRTGNESAGTEITVFRWPNPDRSQLGRVSGTAESNHYFQVGADHRQAAVTSFLIPSEKAQDHEGDGVFVDVRVVGARWFKLPAAIGQSVEAGATNPVQGAAVVAGLNPIAGASDADRLNLSALAEPLAPGVHSFAVQSISKFPLVTREGTTNAFATTVTVFNVVVLDRPVAPVLDFVAWETGACLERVINNLIPSAAGDWAAAIANPPAATGDVRLRAGIQRANWLNLSSNVTFALLPLRAGQVVPVTDTFEVQSISDNRDGGVALSTLRTAVNLVTRPSPQPPGLTVDGVQVGVNGIPAATNVVIASAGSGSARVGQGVVLTVTGTPTQAVETLLNSTRILWRVEAPGGGVSIVDQPFNLSLAVNTPDAGLYRISVVSSNNYANTRAGVIELTNCVSGANTSFTIEVRQRPPVPTVTVANVGVFQDGGIQLVSPSDSGFVVIGEESIRPTYSVTPGSIPGVGGTDWAAADWTLLAADGTVKATIVNAPNFSPAPDLTAASGTQPVTNIIRAVARSLDGALGLAAREMTLVVTPRPSAPALVAGAFQAYDGSQLIAQSGVPVANNSVLRVADAVPDVADHRPTFSMLAQGTNALVADWFMVTNGVETNVALATVNFRPTLAQAPVGTNTYFAVARSTQGSRSLERTTFNLVVTPVPLAPGVTAQGVPRFTDSGDFVIQPELPVVPTVRIPDLVRTNVADVGTRTRPTFQIELLDNVTGADWFVVQGNVRTPVAVNSATYEPRPEDSVVGTNRYEAVARSIEGGASPATVFELIVTGPTAAPALAVGRFREFAGGVLGLVTDRVLTDGGVTTVADVLVEAPADRRPIYRLTGPADASVADWYRVVGGVNQLVRKSVAQFEPTIAEAPVGTTSFFAVARSAEGSISAPTAFTLVVTAVPAAPVVVAGDFLRPDAGGALVNQNTVSTAVPVVVADDAGDPARRRPEFQLSPVGANVVSADWYQVVGGVTNLVGANLSRFRPTVPSTPVGTHVFQAVARSAEGASSARTRFELTVTGTPGAPSLLAQIPQVSADGLSVGNNSGDLPVSAGETFRVGTQAAAQFTADGSLRFTMGDGLNLTPAFTRWNLNGGANSVGATFVPTLVQGTNLVSAVPVSPDGNAGAPVTLTVVVTAPPAAPTVDPVSAVRATCSPAATFTATLGTNAARIVWTAGASKDSTRLRVDPVFMSPADATPAQSPLRFFAWAVSDTGDFSAAPTEVTLTVLPAPEAAQLSGIGLMDGTTYKQAIPVGGTEYPLLRVTNTTTERVEWVLNNVVLSSETEFRPTVAQLPTTMPGGPSGEGTHELTVRVIQANCVNESTKVQFQLVAPALLTTFTAPGTILLQLDAAADLEGRQVTLLTNSSIAGEFTANGAPRTLGAAPTNALGIRRFLVDTLTDPAEGPLFIRVRVEP